MADVLAPRYEFTNGWEWLPLPDLERLAREDMPTEEWYAARDAAALVRRRAWGAHDEPLGWDECPVPAPAGATP